MIAARQHQTKIIFQKGVSAVRNHERTAKWMASPAMKVQQLFGDETDAHNCFMHTPQQHLPYSDNNSFSSFQQVFVCRWFECISLSEHNLPARVAFRAYQGDNGR